MLPKEKKSNLERDNEYFKIFNLSSKHFLVKQKFEKFKNEQQMKINLENSRNSSSKPLEMNSSLRIYGNTISIFSHDDANQFISSIKVFVKALEENPDELKKIQCIIQKANDNDNKWAIERSLEENKFKLLYYEMKPLLENIFPKRKSLFNKDFTHKTESEIKHQIMQYNNSTQSESDKLFYQLTSYNNLKPLIYKYEGKYCLKEENLLFDFN